MELITVIVPVYNVEKYLCDCVDSILASTYSNLEVILIDDGSTDASPQICDSYAQADARVKVIHQENQGLCAARNAGLHVATGKYIGFVDSDDAISPFMYEKLVEAMETTDSDWAACEYARNMETLGENKLSHMHEVHVLEGMKSQLSALTCAPAIREITWTGGYVWNKLYRRKLITTPFVVGCLNVEDLQFNWNYMLNSSTMAIHPQILYMYRENEASITSMYLSQKASNIAKRGISIATVYLNIAENTPDLYPDLKEYLFSRAAHYAHGVIWRIYAHGSQSDHAAYISESRKMIRKHFKTIWKDRSTYPVRARCAIAVFLFAFPIWVILTKIVTLR